MLHATLHRDEQVFGVWLEVELPVRDDDPSTTHPRGTRIRALTIRENDVAIEPVLVVLSVSSDSIEVGTS